MHATTEVAHDELVLTVGAMWGYLPRSPAFRGDSDTGQTFILAEVACIAAAVNARTAKDLFITNAVYLHHGPRHCNLIGVRATPIAGYAFGVSSHSAVEPEYQHRNIQSLKRLTGPKIMTSS